MEYEIAVKGWVRVDADSADDAVQKGVEVMECLTNAVKEKGYDVDPFFEEVGLEPCKPQVNPATAAMSVIMDDEDRRRMFNR